MVYKLYRVASKVVTLNSILRHVERKVLLNTFHKARSNSTVAWPSPMLLKRYSLEERPKLFANLQTTTRKHYQSGSLF
ncbi:hypothetical protein Trydic_g9594 [Trypoxylus dichotomus]